MRAKEEDRAAAVALRQAGYTYEEIASELGVSKSSLSLWLRELPFPTEEQRTALHAPATSTLKPGSGPPGTKDIDGARQMRLSGFLLREIAQHYDIAVKTAWVWCAGLPLPPRARHGGDREHVRRMSRLRWDAELQRREQERAAIKQQSAARVGRLNERELELIAVTAYWCEGSKDKTYERRETVTFINSDKDLILLWLRFLQSKGVGSERLRLNVSIHVSADVARATHYWSEVTGMGMDHFGAPTLKRHNPKTIRKNTGEAYVGCLVVRVLQGRTLYQEIDGVWRGIAAQLS